MLCILCLVHFTFLLSKTMCECFFLSRTYALCSIHQTHSLFGKMKCYYAYASPTTNSEARIQFIAVIINAHNERMFRTQRTNTHTQFHTFPVLLECDCIRKFPHEGVSRRVCRSIGFDGSAVVVCYHFPFLPSVSVIHTHKQLVWNWMYLGVVYYYCAVRITTHNLSCCCTFYTVYSSFSLFLCAIVYIFIFSFNALFWFGRSLCVPAVSRSPETEPFIQFPLNDMRDMTRSVYTVVTVINGIDHLLQVFAVCITFCEKTKSLVY